MYVYGSWDLVQEVNNVIMFIGSLMDALKNNIYTQFQDSVEIIWGGKEVDNIHSQHLSRFASTTV